MEGNTPSPTPVEEVSIPSNTSENGFSVAAVEPAPYGSSNSQPILNLELNLEHDIPSGSILDSLRSEDPHSVGLKDWPISPMPLTKSKMALVLESFMYLSMGICSTMFFGKFREVLLQSSTKNIQVFAILAASVHKTYPGTNIRYRSNEPPLSPPFDEDTTGLTWSFNGPYYGPSYGSLNLSLLQAAKLTPTILPILFASVVGNFLRLFARWKAERGVNAEVK